MSFYKYIFFFFHFKKKTNISFFFSLTFFFTFTSIKQPKKTYLIFNFFFFYFLFSTKHTLKFERETTQKAGLNQSKQHGTQGKDKVTVIVGYGSLPRNLHVFSYSVWGPLSPFDLLFYRHFPFLTFPILLSFLVSSCSKLLWTRNLIEQNRIGIDYCLNRQLTMNTNRSLFHSIFRPDLNSK